MNGSDTDPELALGSDLALGSGYSICKPGDLLAGRYRIVRFIARGGAAEVYEAEDQELRQRVALKAVRREHLSNSVAIERFKREINLARQVTHPNVCRIYEFGVETRGREALLFLTMELLEGETLHDRICEHGPLTVDEALPLLRQMAAGLDAAQKVGVVHRDFKTGNIMLVPSEGEEGGVRTVIADFGMARMASGDDAHIVTGQDLVVGSPAYMAPEQVESGPITAATDIYAVGVVLFEMLTGKFPFQAETALATALMRLQENPPSPRDYVPDLDERWERVILRCLERDPSKRFQSAHQLMEALTGEAPVKPPATGRRLLLAAALSVGVLLALIVGWQVLPVRQQPGAADVAAVVANFEARPSIALLGFRNLSGHEDAAWLSTALSEMLAMEVAAGEAVRVIPGENVARTRMDLGLGEIDDLAADTLARVGQILGSDLIVAGSYLLAGSDSDREIRLDLKVRDASTGETLVRVSERGTEAEVLNLVESAGHALRDGLGVGVISPADAAAVRASMPGGPQAAKLYARGLEELRRHEARAALDLFEAAQASDPDNPMIQSGLSAAWAALGYSLRAREAASRAFELAGDLSREDKLWVEARYREMTRDRKQAAEIYEVLWGFFPDNLEYGLRLAKAQTSVGQGSEALKTVARLRALPSAAGEGPRIDLAEAAAARSLAQYQLQQERAAEAAEKGSALGARLLVARAREVEAGAWRDLGEPDKAMAAYEEAREIHAAANNRGPVARILIAVAKIHRYQGNFDKAKELNETALQVAREIGDQGSIKHALNTLAIILRQQGRLTEALRMHELELETNREIGDGRSVQVALTSLGVVKRHLGQLTGAAANFTEALRLGRESGNMRSVEINLNMLGEVLLHQGRLAEARQHFEEALATNSETGSPRGRAYYVTNLGNVDLAAGDLDAARSGFEEGLAIRESLGEKTNIAYSLLSLASLALEEGRFAEAGKMARDAAEQFQASDQPDAKGQALAVLAKALLEQDQIEEAAAAVAEAQAELEGSENRAVRVSVAIRAAEVAAAAGRAEQGIAELVAITREAKAIGLAGHALEAELILGRLERATGATEAGTRRLEAVAKEADRRGFRLLAAEAAG